MQPGQMPPDLPGGSLSALCIILFCLSRPLLPNVSFHSYYVSMCKQVTLIVAMQSLFRYRNQGSERGSNLPKVTQGGSRGAKVTTQAWATPELFPLGLTAPCPSRHPAGLSTCAGRLLPGLGVRRRRKRLAAAPAGLGACHIFAGDGHEGGGPSWPPGS